MANQKYELLQDDTIGHEYRLLIEVARSRIDATQPIPLPEEVTE